MALPASAALLVVCDVVRPAPLGVVDVPVCPEREVCFSFMVASSQCGGLPAAA
jgi:hypothetical protein